MAEDDLDVGAQLEEESDEPIGGELLDVPRHETRHLRGSIVHDGRGRGPGEAEFADASLQLPAKHCPRDAVARKGILLLGLARPTSLSGHGGGGKGGKPVWACRQILMTFKNSAP